MDTRVLRQIPERKILSILEDTLRHCPICSQNPQVKLDQGLCPACRTNTLRYQRYAQANIPVLYWNLEMEKDFVGDPILKEKYLEITQDLRKTYNRGLVVNFAGLYGRGKSLTVCNILKRVVEKSMSGLYVTLSDIVHTMLNGDFADKAAARKELLTVDFLAIDEFDPRYMANDKAAELFGKILEEIFRTRSQNVLPIMMCTNSPKVVESFSGPFRDSLDSLFSIVTTVPVLGKDQRLENQKLAKGKK